jgi:hypothetical protein
MTAPRTPGGAPTHPRARTDVGITQVGAVGVTILAAVVVAGTLLALFSLWRFWPAAPSAAGISPPRATFSYFGWRVSLTRDQQFLLIAAVAGSLGGLLHSLRSLSTYVGERYLFRSWLLYYVLMPLVGAILATIVYIVLRAGLLPGETAASQPNPYGITAVGALVGLFSEQAAKKLQAIFETVFTSSDQGSESVADIAEPLVTGLDPDHGAVGTSVQINGDKLSGVTGVNFGSTQLVLVTVVSPQRLVAIVPDSAVTGPVTLHTARYEVTSTQRFTVDPTQPDTAQPDTNPAGPANP